MKLMKRNDGAQRVVVFGVISHVHAYTLLLIVCGDGEGVRARERQFLLKWGTPHAEKKSLRWAKHFQGDGGAF